MNHQFKIILIRCYKGVYWIALPWEDLSPSHEMIRKTAQEKIIGYAVSKEGVKPLVIVALYGSGKSTLLSYLEKFSWERGIPAFYITHLSYFIDYLETALREERKRTINESTLPRYLERYFEEKIGDPGYLEEVSKRTGLPIEKLEEAVRNYFNGTVRGAVFIDEIEESFGKLKDIVTAETSPFRALFDKVTKGESKFYVIMAFGPSSALAEATHLAAGWRSETVSIPLVGSEKLRELLKNEDLNLSTDEEELLANTIWWLSKGRYGWALMLIGAGVPRSIINNLRRVREYPLMTFPADETVIENLRKQIVVNVPLLSQEKYERIISKLRNIEEKKLFSVLSVLVGPVPKEVLENYGVTPPKKKLSRVFVKTTKFVSKNAVIGKISDLFSKEANEETLTYLKDYVDKVFTAWSLEDKLPLITNEYNDILVAPYQKLLEVAANIALESYRPDVLGLIEQIDIGEVLRDVMSETPPISDTMHYAINPEFLIEIYPPAVIRPLIACSKERARELRSFLGDLDPSKDAAIIKKAVNFLANQIGGNKPLGNFDIIMVTNRDYRTVKSLKKLILSNIDRESYSIIIPVSTDSKDLERVKEEIKKELKNYIKLGLVGVSDTIGVITSQFLAGLLFSVANCREELENLKSTDKYIVAQASKKIAELISSAVQSIYSGLDRASREIGLDEIRQISEKLREKKGREIGSRQADYFLLVPLAGEKVVGALGNVIDELSGLREDVEQTNSILSRLFGNEFQDIVQVKDIFRDISLLSRKKESRNYLDLSKKLYDTITDKIRSSDIWKALYEVTRDLVKLAGKQGEINDIRKALNEISRKLNILRIGNDSWTFVLAGIALSEASRDTDLIEPNTELCRQVNRELELIRADLEKLVVKRITDLTDALRELNIEPNMPFMRAVEELKENIKLIQKHIDNIKNKALYGEPSNRFSAAIHSKLICELILHTLVKNMKDNFIPRIHRITRTIDNIIGYLNEISDTVDSLPESIKKSVSAIVRDDLKYILRSESLSSIVTGLENYRHPLSRLANKITELHTKIKTIRKLVREINSFYEVAQK